MPDYDTMPSMEGPIQAAPQGNLTIDELYDMMQQQGAAPPLGPDLTAPNPGANQGMDRPLVPPPSGLKGMMDDGRGLPSMEGPLRQPTPPGATGSPPGGMPPSGQPLPQPTPPGATGSPPGSIEQFLQDLIPQKRMDDTVIAQEQPGPARMSDYRTPTLEPNMPNFAVPGSPGSIPLRAPNKSPQTMDQNEMYTDEFVRRRIDEMDAMDKFKQATGL